MNTLPLNENEMINPDIREDRIPENFEKSFLYFSHKAFSRMSKPGLLIPKLRQISWNPGPNLEIISWIFIIWLPSNHFHAKTWFPLLWNSESFQQHRSPSTFWFSLYYKSTTPMYPRKKRKKKIKKCQIKKKKCQRSQKSTGGEISKEIKATGWGVWPTE